MGESLSQGRSHEELLSWFEAQCVELSEWGEQHREASLEGIAQ